MSSQPQSAKVLLVAASSSAPVEAILQRAGCAITDAADGAQALDQARRGSFDLAVLLSTGTAMDVTETIFNLHDARPYMPIFIMSGAISPGEVELVSRACPYVRALSLEQLAAQLALATAPDA